jgi:hypothetical protein
MRLTTGGLILIAAVAAIAAPAALDVKWESGQIRITAANLRFLAGKSVERLKAGESVRYALRVSLLDAERRREEGSVTERMVVSYDLWEERYWAKSQSRQSVSGRWKTLEQTERWMVEQLTVPAPPDRARRYRVRLEVMRDETPAENGEPGLSLTRLVDLFSRNKPREEPERWAAESGEFRPSDATPKPK